MPPLQAAVHTLARLPQQKTLSESEAVSYGISHIDVLYFVQPSDRQSLETELKGRGLYYEER